GRLFGARGHIVLYSFGGLAIGSSSLTNRWKRIAVYLAGPGAGFVLSGVVFLVSRLPSRAGFPFYLGLALAYLWVINLFWGVINLLPIWPLDGGQVSWDFLEWLMPRRGILISLGISAGAAGLLALYFLVQFGSLFNALFFGMLAVTSIRVLLLMRDTG